MAIVNDNRLEISKLDFDGIKASLKTFLQSQTEFTDYDFDGSGMSVLLDVLSYNTHYMSYYLNMVGNEMFLDSATNRYSVVSLAKQMGYVPKSTVAAQALVGFTANVTGGAATATIPAWTKFSVVSDRTKYIFQPVTDIAVATSGGVATFSSAALKEGTYLKNTWVYNDDGKDQKFVIPNKGVDTSTLKVSVKASKSASETDTYLLYTELEKLDSTSKVYFTQEVEDGLYEIYFGDGVYGAKPLSENIITVEYLVSSGAGGNYAGRDVLQRFKLEDSLSDSGGGTPTITGQITTNSYATGGSSPESIESIKHNAPRNYSAQERLVTESDYKNIVLTKYSNAKAVKVWSGDPIRKLSDGETEENGVVYISIVPQVATSFGGLDEYAKNYVTNVLLDPYRILGIRNKIIDPNFTKLKIRSDVYINSSLGYGSDNDTVKRAVIESIKDYSDTNLGTFDVSFRYSKLLYAIDQADKSILSNDTHVSYAAQTSLATDKQSWHGGWGYERSASNQHKGDQYNYTHLKAFSWDVKVVKGSIFSDWFYVHVDAMHPDATQSYSFKFGLHDETEWSWDRDIRKYNWDDPHFPTAVGVSEYVSLIKVRFVDDKRRSSAYREKWPSNTWQGKGVDVDKRTGFGFLHLVTDGGHLVPFTPYKRANASTAGTQNFDPKVDVPSSVSGESSQGQYTIGHHWGVVDYKKGEVRELKPIPIFAFANDVTETVYTNEDKTLSGIYDESLHGSIVLNSTKAKEEDRDKLNVHVDLMDKNRDIVPSTNTVLTLDTSTLTADIKIIDQKNEKITQ